MQLSAKLEGTKLTVVKWTRDGMVTVFEGGPVEDAMEALRTVLSAHGLGVASADHIAPDRHASDGSFHWRIISS